MNSKKLYYILMGVVGLLVVGLISGAYGANVLLQAQAQTLVEARSKSAALELQQSQLTKAKASVAKYSAISAVAKSIVPQDKNQAQTVRELVNIASKNSITLATISFPNSTLGTKVVPVAPTAGAANSTAPTTPAPAPAAGATTQNLSQLTPLTTISGVYTLQIIIQSDAMVPIPYEKFISFLSDLESNRRTALVSGITLTPDGKDPTKISFTLNLNEYIKP